MSCGIYKIKNKINNKVYIGLSKNIEQRWKHHIWESQNEKQAAYFYSIHKAFRKYGLQNFSFEIIEKCKEEELTEKEKYWIHYYDSYNNGYNETLGGDGGPALKGSKNLKAKLTEFDVFTIRKRALNKEMPRDVYADYKNIVTRNTFDKVWRGETWKDILPEAIQYVKSSEYQHIVKGEHNKNKNKEIKNEIVQKQQQGENRLEVFKDYSNLYTLSGFNKIWYANNQKEEKTKIIQININTNEIIDTFLSAAEAERKTGCDSSSIIKVCKGKRKSCGGFNWRYDKDIH